MPAPAGLDALLTALQWTDSAFPSGLYTLSHGLEAIQQAGLAGDDWVEVAAGLLRDSVGPADTTATFLAHRAAAAGDVAGLVEIDLTLAATRLPEGTRRASTRVGRQLLTMAAELDVDSPTLTAYAASVADRGRATAPGNQAVAVAVIQQAQGVPAEACAAAELAGWANAVAGAAIRLRLTDHVGAQRGIVALRPAIRDALADAADRPLAELGRACPALDFAAAAHETAPARLFMT